MPLSPEETSSDENSTNGQDNSVTLRKAERLRITTSIYDPSVALISQSVKLKINNFQDVLLSPNKDLWISTMDDEHNSLVLNKLYSVVDKTTQLKIIGSRYNDDIRGVYLILFVDDMLIFSPNTEISDEITLALSFEMKVFGKPKVFIGLELIYAPGKLYVTQRDFFENLSSKYGHQATPCQSYPPQFEGIPIKKSEMALYQELIGSLLFLGLGSRPDIFFVVNYLSRFTVSPLASYLKSTFNILGYLHMVYATLTPIAVKLPPILMPAWRTILCRKHLYLVTSVFLPSVKQNFKLLWPNIQPKQNSRRRTFLAMN